MKVSRSLGVAIPVENTVEVLQLQRQEISPIPGVEPWLLGAMNQNGDLLWVLHLESFLGLKSSPMPNPLMAVVVTAKFPDRPMRRIACTVFEIEEMLALDADKLRPLPPNLPPRAKALFRGLAKHNETFRAVLDPIALFTALQPQSPVLHPSFASASQPTPLNPLLPRGETLAPSLC